MSYKYKSLDNRRKAKRNLEKLLKEIADIPKSDNSSFQAMSSIGKTSAYYMKLKNVEGVHLYSDGPDRWYADAVLKDVPDGISKVFGIPVKMPATTYQEAWDFARGMILFLRDVETTEEKPESIGFEFDEVSLMIPMEAYDFISNIRSKGPDFEEGYIEDLMLRTRERLGGVLTRERMEGASDQDKAAIATACIFAIMTGINRWPENVYDETTDKHLKPFRIRAMEQGATEEELESGLFAGFV